MSESCSFTIDWCKNLLDGDGHIDSILVEIAQNLRKAQLLDKLGYEKMTYIDHATHLLQLEQKARDDFVRTKDLVESESTKPDAESLNVEHTESQSEEDDPRH